VHACLFEIILLSAMFTRVRMWKSLESIRKKMLTYANVYVCE